MKTFTGKGMLLVITAPLTVAPLRDQDTLMAGRGLALGIAMNEMLIRLSPASSVRSTHHLSNLRKLFRP